MDGLVSALAWLFLLALVFGIMLKPLAPGFVNTFGQQMGNCMGRIVAVAIVVLGAWFLMQSCWNYVTGQFRRGVTSRTSQQNLAENGGITPPNINIPGPPEVALPGSWCFCPPVKECKGRPLQYSARATRNDAHNQYSVAYLGSYIYNGDGFSLVNSGCHPGWDIRVPYGTELYSVADGKVICSRSFGGWGKVVTLQVPYNGQSLYFVYAHLSSIADGIKIGEPVKWGQPIGRSGRTGPDQDHLHFQGEKSWQAIPYFPPNPQGLLYDNPLNPCNQTVYQDEARKRTFDPLKLVLDGILE